MNAPTAFPDPKPVPPYKHTPLFPLGPDTTPSKKIRTDGGRVEKGLCKDILSVSPNALRPLRTTPCTANNMPAQCETYARGGSLDADLAHKFMCMAKGGGSAHKSFLFQATPSVLTRDRMLAFLKEKVLTLGTAACPPYHLAIVIGGTSAELCMKTVKLASARYLDALPTHGSADGNAFRDLEMEQEILKMTQSLAVGAQFGGKYFCHDVRVIRLPRHGASLPIGLGVSCSAARQVLGKITKDGVYLEELEHNPAQYLPAVEQSLGGEVVKIDLNQPMKEILATLSKHPTKTRVSMTGTMVVARDSAHAKLRQRLGKGEPLPAYFKKHL